MAQLRIGRTVAVQIDPVGRDASVSRRHSFGELETKKLEPLTGG
jgi:hypothetical protein